MKKEVYFIIVKREGNKEMNAEERQGYIYTDRYDNKYGCTKSKSGEDGVWLITELKTGHLVNIIGRDPCYRSEIPDYIDSIADFVNEHIVKNENAYPKAKAIIKEAYAKWEREHIASALH